MAAVNPISTRGANYAPFSKFLDLPTALRGYTPGNVGGHHNDEALCSFNKMAAAATALFSSTEAPEAAAACAATSEAVEFMWATEAAEAAEATAAAVTTVVGKMAALFVLGNDQGNLLKGYWQLLECGLIVG